MRIVSWNCNGALRKKFEKLRSLAGDIYVVQECENPAASVDIEYQKWRDQSLWLECSKHKGIGIFSDRHRLKKLDWASNGLESFLPFTIDDEIIAIAVWTRYANSPTFGYIGQFWKYLQLHKDKIQGEKVIICGDFNSSVRWDKWDRWWNHSDVVKELSAIEIESAYHHSQCELQGEETRPTLFLQRNRQKPYHIDYFFITSAYLATASVEIGSVDDWLECGDHMPISLEIEAVSE